MNRDSILINSFGIGRDLTWRILAEKLNGQPLSEDQNTLTALVAGLKNKILIDQTTPPSMVRALAHYISENQEALMLDDDAPLMQEVFMIRSVDEVGPKNPYSLFAKLTKLSKKIADFQPPTMVVEGSPVGINMNQLQALSQGSKIKREDLPANANRKSFDLLAQNLKSKYESDPERANKALADLGTTWTGFSYPLFNDPYLGNLLDYSDEVVAETEAKWRAVLSNILDKKTDEREGSFFTEQQEVLIKTLMGIQNCNGGKQAGIASSYDLLDPQYRYKIQLSKPMSLIEENEHLMRLEAIKFVKDFVDSHPNMERGEMPSSLAILVNEGNNARHVVPLIGEGDYWDMNDDDPDDLNQYLNELGASEMLAKVAKNLKKLKQINQFITQDHSKVDRCAI